MRNKLILIIVLFGFMAKNVFPSAPEGPTGSGTSGLLIEDDKNKKSIWKNLWTYYKKTREWAQNYIYAINSVSDLLYGTYSMLKKWEDISKKAVWLATNNPFDGNGIQDRIENAENWFRTSDELFFKDVPSAMKEREMLTKQKNAMVAAFRAGGVAGVGSASAQAYAESYQKGYLTERGLQKNGAKDGRKFLSPEEEALQQLIEQNAAAMAKQHEQTKLLQQEDAVNQAVGQDVYEMVNCADDKVCGGIAERSDAENRMGMLDQRRALLARRQSEASTTMRLQDILAATQIYVTQGVITTAYLGALLKFQTRFCDANNLAESKSNLPTYEWGALYPSAYKYNGKIYGPDIHYYDSYK